MSASPALAGRRAVVTGGGRGIGAAVARALAAEGAGVVVAARSRGEIEAVAEGLRAAGHAAWAIPCDVTDPDQVAALAEATEAQIGGAADILVNNAGIAVSAPFAATTLDDWQRHLAVNATAAFLCSRAFLGGMRKRGWGRIVNVASVAGKVGSPYIAAYAASKHAVVGLTRALACEVARQGVTVNAVCPGYVDTPLTDAAVGRIVDKAGLDAAEARSRLEGMSPQHRLFAPDEVAHLVSFLCDPRSGGLNGQAIVLDGGAVQS